MNEGQREKAWSCKTGWESYGQLEWGFCNYIAHRRKEDWTIVIINYQNRNIFLRLLMFKNCTKSEEKSTKN